MDENLWAVYDAMGASFVDHAADGAYNAHYDRPAVLAAIGAVEGLDVLDAACGPGFYLQKLVDAGARVRGFDASEEMVRLAKERVGGEVDIRRADLDSTLPYDDESFDLIVCALAIHYSSDRSATFGEFFRLLRPGGRCVVSTGHPASDFARKAGSYFDVVMESDTWNISDTESYEVRFWREPLSSLTAAATDSGFVIRSLIEPRPTESMLERWPEDHAELSRAPAFLVLDLLRLA
ncbi:class I SAM-dependent methyltransferase [Rhodococcoides yunnanense]|uniref:class I SAM-dependent methyltransferase n=1 Tax=Rhodococcoides yunnanense TaxID=278209 RepID=UPI001473C822|nr:class I SAM-dependent methyltransferase [Rhodococcus yunnanensis]